MRCPIAVLGALFGYWVKLVLVPGRSAATGASTAVNRIEGLMFALDHAGVSETILLAETRIELVHLDRLP